MDDRTPARASGRDAPEWQVVVRYPSGEEHQYLCSATRAYLGRGVANDISLGHPFVASRHLKIEATPNEFLVTDLGSAGNTRRSGEVLEPFVSQRVREGELIEVGPLRLHLERILEGEIIEDPMSEPRPRARAPRAADPGPASVLRHPSPVSRAPSRAPGAGGAERTQAGGTRPRPGAADFLTWRSAIARPLGGVEARYGTRLRLLRVVAGLVIFAAVVALVVLVVL